MRAFRRDEARGWMSPVTFHVLLSLIDGHRHGYAIKQEIHGRTAGTVSLAVGTLYEALYRLEREGFVRWVPSEAESAGAPRRTYALTPVGRQILRREVGRLEALVDQAHNKNVRALPA